MTMPVQTTVEPDEAEVEEVRCSETGVPLPSIPAWYANVNVKFISQQAAKKHGAINPALLPDADSRTPALDSEGEAEPAALDSEGEAEPALDEIELDEIELDDADIADEADSADEA